MALPAERTALRLAGRAFVAVLVVLAAIPAYLVLAPSWRQLAARLACAALVAAACARVIRSVRESTGGHAPSALDAPAAHPPGPELDDRFLRLRDELRFSSRSRQYFDTILWPQLRRLGNPDAPPPAPRRRRRHDGPPLHTLERLIADVEQRA